MCFCLCRYASAAMLLSCPNSSCRRPFDIVAQRYCIATNPTAPTILPMPSPNVVLWAETLDSYVSRVSASSGRVPVLGQRRIIISRSSVYLLTKIDYYCETTNTAYVGGGLEEATRMPQPSETAGDASSLRNFLLGLRAHHVESRHRETKHKT